MRDILNGNVVFELNDELWFPHPEELYVDDRDNVIRYIGAGDQGFIAVGGDLRTERLLLAYDNGYFPWYPFRKCEIHWYCPRQRFVIFPDEIHVSHSMRTLMNKHQYRVTFNTAFDQVIRGCGTVDGRINDYGAWLGDNVVEAYTRLHELGRARSVEVWRGDTLAGGLYGVTCGNGFVGESMFSLEPSASKLALIALARHMQEHGGTLIDCQEPTPHLKSMGGRFIGYKEYITLMRGPEAYHSPDDSPTRNGFAVIV